MSEPEDYSLYALKIAERAADIFASLGEGEHQLKRGQLLYYASLSFSGFTML
jgi:hypothetical protein